MFACSTHPVQGLIRRDSFKSRSLEGDHGKAMRRPSDGYGKDMGRQYAMHRPDLSLAVLSWPSHGAMVVSWCSLMNLSQKKPLLSHSILRILPDLARTLNWLEGPRAAKTGTGHVT